MTLTQASLYYYITTYQGEVFGFLRRYLRIIKKKKYENVVLKFDKLKIISTIDNIKNINENEFQSIIRDGIIKEQKLSIKSPYSLYIEADYTEGELVIEFTGKILKDDYPSLINKDNIRICLSNINELGFCNLNIDGILSDGEVVKADVCQDVIHPDYKDLTKSLRASVSNFNKYFVRNIGDNFIIEKNVQTKSYKRRLTIYDKQQELERASNRNFLNCVEDKDKLLSSFNGTLRFEMNLNSKEQLRQCLNITDTSISSVLHSGARPLWDFLDKAIADSKVETAVENVTDLKNRLLLEHCDNDLTKVEAVLRKYCSPRTHISQVMKPYRALAEKLSNNLTPSVKQQLRNLLMEIVIMIGILL